MGIDSRGRWYRWDKKDTVDGYLKLDMARLKDVDFERNAFLSFTWTTKNYFGDQKSSLGFWVLPGQGLRLHYKHNGEDIDPYVVPVVYTTPNYGGKRYWFLCPNIHCQRRVRILYGGKYFVCRHCHNLTYSICQESHANALESSISRRMQRIRNELGADGTLQGSLPNKPPRMHWRTYERLIGEHYELAELQEAALLQAFVALSGRDAGGLIWDAVRGEWAEHKRRRHEDPDSFRWLAARYYCEATTQADEANRLTLGELAKLANVPYDFAKEAVSEGLLRADQGRGTRRKRYRRRLARWLGKLHVLRAACMSWSEIHDWTARRWQPGHEAERQWPQEMTPL